MWPAGRRSSSSASACMLAAPRPPSASRSCCFSCANAPLSRRRRLSSSSSPHACRTTPARPSTSCAPYSLLYRRGCTPTCIASISCIHRSRCASPSRCSASSSGARWHSLRPSPSCTTILRRASCGCPRHASRMMSGCAGGAVTLRCRRAQPRPMWSAARRRQTTRTGFERQPNRYAIRLSTPSELPRQICKCKFPATSREHACVRTLPRRGELVTTGTIPCHFVAALWQRQRAF
mmetsp:Transcript_61389/g.168610  ORF Transcript_61389/g.168610 Transcript_61389/m.168610 type:complete len:235 (+) Transcript_61389:330-1034(+)